MDLPEPPRPDQKRYPPPPPAIPPQAPPRRSPRTWPWVAGVVVAFVLIVLGALRANNADNPPPAETTDVGSIPVFDGQSGGQVVALVNNQGIVSAKVLGELPTACAVDAGNVVQWDKSSATYQDTGQVAADITGEPATSLMATFFGPIGTGDQQGYVFHADMDLQPPYPNAIVVTLDCSY